MFRGDAARPEHHPRLQRSWAPEGPWRGSCVSDPDGEPIDADTFRRPDRVSVDGDVFRDLRMGPVVAPSGPYPHLRPRRNECQSRRAKGGAVPAGQSLGDSLPDRVTAWRRSLCVGVR